MKRCYALHSGHLAGALVVLAATSLAGWPLGSTLLTRVHPGFAAMVPSTAVAFILLGVALFARRAGQDHAGLFAKALGGLATANLLAYAWLGTAGLDPAFLALNPGDGVSLCTITCFLLAAVTLLLRLSDDAALHEVADYVGLVGLSTALAVVGGHVLHAEFLYEIGFFAAMSLPTAMLFCIAFAGLLMTDEDHEALDDGFDGPYEA
ncbi:hypothetical protein [Pseudooceanicola nanhaiensis]|uniref:hypothetical protein n=1 Tax=Pseudooceanicola nanhaiensis TaxID=375761 RepID=UPI001CD5A0C1|nr:hypothetical protein [Pseudooceanicola nanhaiensis]MCA0921459.1 hypothetical protein [Pseudooceanicola nanhaiensis]